MKKTKSTPSRSERPSTNSSSTCVPLHAPLEQYFLNRDNLYVHYRVWNPQATAPPPRAVVLLCHGIGEHSGRYDHVARVLCNASSAVVFALDHQGHGKSEGDRMFVSSFDDYVDDVATLREIIRRHPLVGALPVYVLGHSMGGLIAVMTLLKHQNDYAGAVISAPALDVGASVLEKSIARVASAMLPKLPLFAVNPNLLCKTRPQVVDLYVNDPLNSTAPAPARLAAEILRAIDVVFRTSDKAEACAEESDAKSLLPETQTPVTNHENNASDVTLPYLLLHGTDDVVCLARGVERFHLETSSTDKTYVTLDGLYHEIFNEKGDAAIHATVSWLNARTLGVHGK